MKKIIDLFYDKQTQAEIKEIVENAISTYYPKYIVDTFMAKDSVRVKVYDNEGE